MAVNVSRKIQLLTGLSILVWMRFISALSKAIRNSLLNLLVYLGPGGKGEDGILESSYKLMQQRLRESLYEIDRKKRQLVESEEQLRKSRDFLQTIIDSLDEDLLVIDSERRIIQANKSLHLKYQGKEIVGRHCYEVTHGLSCPCGPPEFACPANDVWQSGKPARATHRLRHDHQDGVIDSYLEIGAFPIFSGNGNISRIVELSRDVTESKELERQILEVNRHLLAMNAIASTVSQSLSLDIVLDSALCKCLDLIEAEAGSIGLLDEKSQTLSNWLHSGLSDRFIKGTAVLAMGESIAGKVAEWGETLVVHDICTDSRINRPVVTEEGLRAFISVPLKSKERVVGVLNIASRRPRRFSQQEIHLSTALGHQLGIAIENAQLYKDLQIKEQLRAELLGKIISVQEDERRRVARELHDVTSQTLSIIALQLETITTTPDADVTLSDIKSKVENLKPVITTASKEVHRLIYDLRPSLLDDLGLAAALRSCAHDSLGAAGVEVHFEVVGQERKIPPQVEIALFRIVQEAITNIAHHAQAESTYISLEFGDSSIMALVEDDGIGFKLSQGRDSADRGEAVGLLGMKERAGLLRGYLTIDTKPGSGTRVAAEIPVDWGQSDVND